MTTGQLLDSAAERGIINAAQREALGTLERELSATTMPPRAEARAAFNLVTVAYVIGALLVVFASVWFLVDRWQALGPWGVLVVTVVYATLVLVGRAWLEQRGFRHAAAIALTLVVVLVPVMVWCLEAITGFWPAGVVSGYLEDGKHGMAGRWVVVDIVTLCVGLFAFRKRPSMALTIPMTIVLWTLGLHLTQAITGSAPAGALDRWLMFANGLLVCTVAGEVDRWQEKRGADAPPASDFAFFPWIGGLLAFAIGYLALWGEHDVWRHSMVVVAAILITASLYLRRRAHLAFGLLGLFGYLAYLALDVFRAYVSLPVVLALLGVLLIGATVWMQRRFPRLVEQVNAERSGAAIHPIVTWGPLAYAIAMAVLSSR